MNLLFSKAIIHYRCYIYILYTDIPVLMYIYTCIYSYIYSEAIMNENKNSLIFNLLTPSLRPLAYTSIQWTCV